MNCLLDLLAAMDWDTGQSNIHTAALGCVKALMNNSVSREVLYHTRCVHFNMPLLYLSVLTEHRLFLTTAPHCCKGGGGDM